MSSLILSGARFVNEKRVRINEYDMTLLKRCVVYNGDVSCMTRGGWRASDGRGARVSARVDGFALRVR